MNNKHLAESGELLMKLLCIQAGRFKYFHSAVLPGSSNVSVGTHSSTFFFYHFVAL